MRDKKTSCRLQVARLFNLPVSQSASLTVKEKQEEMQIQSAGHPVGQSANRE